MINLVAHVGAVVEAKTSIEVLFIEVVDVVV